MSRRTGDRFEDARSNREYWDSESEAYQRRHGRQLARRGRWGIWGIPEAEVRALGDVRGRRVLELGCGGAQWSAWLAETGGRPVGLDNSGLQLAHARRFVARRRVRVPLVQAAAERLPFADASFDVVFCDHGGMSFADPELTIPEVARVLRPGGTLTFNMSSPLLHACWNPEADAVDECLHGDYFRMRRFAFAEGIVEYQLPYGAWIGLFRRHGLVVEELLELRPSPRATTTYGEVVARSWARRWPAENLWRVRKPA